MNERNFLYLPIEARKSFNAYVDKFGKGTDTDLITRSMILGGLNDNLLDKFDNIVFSAIKKGARLDNHELEVRLFNIPKGAKT